MFEEIACKISDYVEKKDLGLSDCKICKYIQNFTKKQCIINRNICMRVLICLFNRYNKKRVM